LKLCQLLPEEEIERIYYNMKLQRLLSLIRQAVEQYQLIEDGDHIALGISGGKDS